MFASRIIAAGAKSRRSPVSPIASSMSTMASSATKLAAPSGAWKNTELSSIRYGIGCLSSALQSSFDNDVKGASRALIVTGKSLNTKTDVIKQVRNALGNRYVATVDDISQHAPVAAIHKTVDLVKKEKIDVLVSVGGGSPIDSAKAISYFVHEELNKGNDDPRTFLPSIAIPTTLSVAETTQNAGFTSEKQKTGVSHEALVPRVIILDAALTAATPQHLWLSSGIRAVDHAIEALYRPGDLNYILRPLCLNALRDLFALLRLCHNNPNDLDVRQRLQLAAIGSLFPEARKGALGLSHGFGHALGSTYEIPHGVTSCLTLAASIEYTARLPSTPPEALASLADALPFVSPGKYTLQPPYDGPIDVDEARERGVKVAKEVNHLLADLDLVTSLSQWKVPRSDYEKIAKKLSAKDPEQKDALVNLLESIS